VSWGSFGPVSKSSYFLGDPPPDPRFLTSLGALLWVELPQERTLTRKCPRKKAHMKVPLRMKVGHTKARAKQARGVRGCRGGLSPWERKSYPCIYCIFIFHSSTNYSLPTMSLSSKYQKKMLIVNNSRGTFPWLGSLFKLVPITLNN
jgi:hypothetical protein